MNKRVKINTPAPDFSLLDFMGNNFVLSEYEGKKNVALIFNRGFT
jgi:peroxiredoxin